MTFFGGVDIAAKHQQLKFWWPSGFGIPRRLSFKNGFLGEIFGIQGWSEDQLINSGSTSTVFRRGLRSLIASG